MEREKKTTTLLEKAHRVHDVRERRDRDMQHRAPILYLCVYGSCSSSSS